MINITEGKYAKYLEGPGTKKGKAKEFAKIKVARKAYNLEVKKFKKNWGEVNKLIDKHVAKQIKDPLEWKFVGDMSLYNDKLDDIIERIKMGLK
jgi:hypothetical protein